MYQAGGPRPHEVMNHIRRPPKRWRPRPHGADRLFNYLEASDSEDEMEMLPEDLVCQQCGLEFLDTESLQTHLMSMHRMTLAPSQGPAPRPYHCTICGYSSPSHPEIVAHMQKHAVVEMRCCEPGCRFSSSVPGAMEEHVRLAHPPMPPLNQKCPHCGFVVLSGTALSRHAKTHHLATVQCTPCNRVLLRFDRHRTGEMWSEEEQEDDEELMAAAAQAAEDAVNAIEDDGDEEGEMHDETDGPTLMAGGDGASLRTPSDHELALQALRFHWRVRRRRVRHFRALRKHLQSVMEARRAAAEAEDAGVAARLRQKHVGQWLVRRRLGCFACPPGRRHAWNLHSAASLALHAAWRHPPNPAAFACDSCDARFRHRYQSLLHASRDHAEQETLEEAAGGVVQQHEPIVTLTVPQYLAASSTATTTTAPGHQQLTQQHLQLQHDPQAFAQMDTLQVQQVYQVQAGADGTAAEGYAMDNVTVVPAVLYVPQDQQAQQQAQADPQAEADTQQEQFQAPIYNGMMVPTVPADMPAEPTKQVWYPQLATPSYYISTQFPST
ncbi:uncharacterized protein LOC113209556 [Frankliniella occidentalis]|uniref:Uncharacterized protein LOC113209556 n=1 Tax=Frankliniella occidentalis TaxID=133901 RepID=A0A9C6U8T3_FRAOC|nr:uncharacterized protein LOC113209556 [Frankliniella occidentalis]XP_052124013.1 uncharacterized protein LOC113209556 [Frankliniella occidentalis]